MQIKTNKVSKLIRAKNGKSKKTKISLKNDIKLKMRSREM